jgi:hypothetical protein
MVTPGMAKLIANPGRREAQFGTDLAQSPTLGVQIGRPLNVHARNRSESQPERLPLRSGVRSTTRWFRQGYLE